MRSNVSSFSELHLMVIRCIQHTLMQQGTIAGITDKGFGFIKIEGAEKDLFFHMNDLVDVRFDDLRQGDKVEFEVTDGPKGKNAINIKRI